MAVARRAEPGVPEFDMRDPRLFWSHFSDIRETVEARLSALQGVVPPCELIASRPGWPRRWRLMIAG